MHKVWVADDDEAIGLILEESLRNAGFDTKIFLYAFFGNFVGNRQVNLTNSVCKHTSNLNW